MLTLDEYRSTKDKLDAMEQAIPSMIASSQLDGLTALNVQSRIDWMRHELRKEKPETIGVFRHRRTAKMAVGDKLVYDSDRGCWKRRR